MSFSKLGPRFDNELVAFMRWMPLWREVCRMSGDERSNICRDLFRGLMCKSYAFDSTRMSLPPRLDQAWHFAILNTKLYREMCMAEFGRFLEHKTTTQTDSVREKNKRVDATIVLYKAIFNESPTTEFWKKEEEEEQEHLQVVKPRRQSKRLAGNKRPRKEEADEEQKLSVNVKKLNGTTFTLRKFPPSTTIFTLKTMLQSLYNVPTDQQRLIWAGKQLKDENTCQAYKIPNEAVIHLVEKLRGC